MGALVAWRFPLASLGAADTVIEVAASPKYTPASSVMGILMVRAMLTRRAVSTGCEFLC